MDPVMNNTVKSLDIKTFDEESDEEMDDVKKSEDACDETLKISRLNN